MHIDVHIKYYQKGQGFLDKTYYFVAETQKQKYLIIQIHLKLSAFIFYFYLIKSLCICFILIPSCSIKKKKNLIP